MFFEKVIKKNKFTNRVYEIGSGVAYTQNDMQKLALKKINKTPYIIHIPKTLAKLIVYVTGLFDIEQVETIEVDTIPNLTRLKRDFNIIPRSFQEGLFRKKVT